jgi:hypothetical protein
MHHKDTQTGLARLREGLGALRYRDGPGAVPLPDLARAAGMPVGRVVELVRHHAPELGGSYLPPRCRHGVPRARCSCWPRTPGYRPACFLWEPHS